MTFAKEFGSGTKWKIVVFIPAYNEESNIGEVIRRIPRRADARWSTEVLVIDDGSRDATADRARAAGAEHVVSFEANRGLGAAVREGLARSVAMGADVAVMIDADCEYPPEQIPELVDPILRGQADYVLGSRFLGEIRGMKRHRRIGNRFFSLLQSVLLGMRIVDGQTGMRAFSAPAARHAEIIHDYNYAQVLTLNLVRKGFRLLELPIRYRVRTRGRSFITFAGYMGNVLPAIWKEMRRKVETVKESDRAAERKVADRANVGWSGPTGL